MFNYFKSLFGWSDSTLQRTSKHAGGRNASNKPSSRKAKRIAQLSRTRNRMRARGKHHNRRMP